ncbi:Acetyl-coenzyme A synthetase, cytoplasmic [Araneus ventricosus]|uniref:Acetyl-coenzyme A synthetase, cytoplasmic n=1 Tax=Araneus ventricosus TaxID=182803 RepID=A0A4Y2FCW0_ARAVE|nr:Acetyl-coenzyme A synthetase, cytoplasmic [Araneus ventricosus]
MRDEDGFFWVTGRVDDMLNVSGHLLSTTAVEASLMGHKSVAETSVVSHPHPVKGECLYCFVVPKDVSTKQMFSFQKLIHEGIQGTHQKLMKSKRDFGSHRFQESL